MEFMRALWELDHALRRASKSMEARLGVTGPQRLVIRLVGHDPGARAGDLADALHIDPSSLTGILDRLEAAGLLTRRSDRKDRRRAVLTLTAKGRKLDRVRAGTAEAAVVRVLKTQPRSRIADARILLSALASELGAVSSTSAD
jgi:DNA-binding MarR family transcriptional regulator